MKRLHQLTITVLAIVVLLANSNQAGAIGSSLILSQIQTRGGIDDSASNEMIEIYNNSPTAVNLASWSLKYGQAGMISPSRTILDFGDLLDEPNTYLFLPAFTHLTLASNSPDMIDILNPSFTFSAGLSDKNRWLALYDDKRLVDLVQWSSSNVSDLERSTAERESPAILANPGQVLGRQMLDEDIYQDTDNNYDDFISQDIVVHTSQVYEVYDICPNLDGIQIELPDGYEDINGQCRLLIDETDDMCLNIDGQQLDLLYGYEVDDDGNCVVYDVCPNLDGSQMTLPPNYEYDGDLNCIYQLELLELSEVLPNPDGEDKGSEFIEIYNPNQVAVSLDDYVLYYGDDVTNVIDLSGIEIAPYNYEVIYNQTVKFTLTNTQFSLHLMLKNSNYESYLSYDNAKSGQTWAMINKSWQYTNRPTPGSKNLPSTSDSSEVLGVSDDGMVPCKEGYYRNPATNRCKKIEVEEELEPCKDGYERNPETNRCRKIVADSGLEPCKEGYERNPETNRCRKVVLDQIPGADYKPEAVEFNDSSSNTILVGSIIGLGTIMIGYAIWEWHVDIARLYKKIKSSWFRKNKSGSL